MVVVPASFLVIRHLRPKLGWTAGERIDRRRPTVRLSAAGPDQVVGTCIGIEVCGPFAVVTSRLLAALVEALNRSNGRTGSTVGQVVLGYYSPFHDELDALKLGDIGKRINDVRVFAGFD